MISLLLFHVAKGLGPNIILLVAKCFDGLGIGSRCFFGYNNRPIAKNDHKNNRPGVFGHHVKIQAFALGSLLGRITAKHHVNMGKLVTSSEMARPIEAGLKSTDMFFAMNPPFQQKKAFSEICVLTTLYPNL